MRIHFCTYFDRNYVSRAMALYDSIVPNCDDFMLWVLCLDRESQQIVESKELVNVRVVGLDHFEQLDPELYDCKSSRTIVEYYFTLTAAWVHFVLNSEYDVEIVCYMDADMMFFSNIAPLLSEFGDASIGITGHRFPSRLKKLERYGRFNVGLLLFRNDAEGRGCAARWRSQCISWCYDRLEEGRFADQKYLDEWPELYERVHIVEHEGVNAASWNISNYELSLRDGVVYVDHVPLICFHFHGFKQLSPYLYWCNFSQELQRPSRQVKEWVMRPYIEALNRNRADCTVQIAPAGAVRSQGGRLMFQIRRVCRYLKGAVFGDFLIHYPENSRPRWW